MIQAVTFDFWGTLYRDQPGMQEEWTNRRCADFAAALAGTGVSVSAQRVREGFDESLRRATLAWRSEYRDTGTCEAVDTVLEVLGVTVSDETRSRLTVLVEEQLLSHPPFLLDGAREVLADLSQDYGFGIISDTGLTPGRVLREILRRDGLLGYFATTTFSDETGRTKPHVVQFATTMRNLGVPPERAVHVGDLAATDLAGAKAAGMKTILTQQVTEGQEDGQADAVIASLWELPEVVRKLLVG